MNKLTTTAFALAITATTTSASAVTFTGSLYMLDSAGNPAIDNTVQCPTCNASVGEIDNNLSTVITGYNDVLYGNSDILDTGLSWSLTNIILTTDPFSGENIVTGIFNWTNYVGLTTSTFSQNFTVDPFGNITALDPDGDGVKGAMLLDGPFLGDTIYFEGTISSVPVPAAAWLFGSGMIGLITIAKRKSI